MNDCISNEIEKASEKIVAFDEIQVQGWLFSPQFLAILQITKITDMIFMMLTKRNLTDAQKAPYEGRKELYSDVSIFITGDEGVEAISGRDNKKVKAISTTCHCLRLSSRKNNKQVASVSKVKKIGSFAILPLLRIHYLSVNSVRCDSSQRPNH